jgi:hypothetical protein
MWALTANSQSTADSGRTPTAAAVVELQDRSITVSARTLQDVHVSDLLKLGVQ